MGKIIAWHGSAELKAEVLARLQAHREADDFVRGLYQTASTDSPLGYRGCALGCTLPLVTGDDRLQGLEAGFWHYEIQRRYGIDIEVAGLIDEIFESLETVEESAQFAQDVAAAIPVGADLSEIGGRVDLAWDADVAAHELIAALAAAPVDPAEVAG